MTDLRAKAGATVVNLLAVPTGVDIWMTDRFTGELFTRLVKLWNGFFVEHGGVCRITGVVSLLGAHFSVFLTITGTTRLTPNLGWMEHFLFGCVNVLVQLGAQQMNGFSPVCKR